MSGAGHTAPDPGSPSQAPLGPIRAALTAFAILLVANTVALALTEAPTQGQRVRGLHHLYQTGRLLGAALVVALAIALCRRVPPLRRHGLLVLAAVSLTVGALTLAEDAANFSGNLVPFAPRLALWATVALVSGGVAVAARVGRLLDRPRWRWLAVLAGAAVLGAHPFVLQTGYPGVHLYLAAGALALITGALIGAPVPKVWPRLARALPWALAAGLALFTFLVPPSNSLQLQMLQQEGDVVTPFVSRLGTGGEGSDDAVPAAWKPWFSRRDDVAPVPAGAPLVKDPIVILITIDSLRADWIDGKKYDKQLPNLAALRDRSLHFTAARAPGSQTVYTISEFFMGKYYSQQYWSTHKVHRDLWPDDDDSVRFPQLLADAGVATVHLATTKWLTGDAGIVRGFSDERFVEPAKTRYTLSAETLPHILQRLEEQGPGPLFLYTHMLDAHYTVSPLPGKSAKRKMLANLGLIDESLGEIVAAVERLGLAGRTFVIVSADHGEAFGEHNTHNHRYTIYEELLRVPLMITGPGIKARDVDQPVSVIDIGPTVLDLFGLPTPGHYMGQSLAGFMRGQDPELTRPIAAETRLKKALLFPDGYKAIVDDRHGTSEVYNLRSDPGELINLIDNDDPGAAARVETVRTFFDTHKVARPGYKIPFRP